ncbi:MAG TPA: hypothetical protein VFQ27_06980 [Xanthobacteraceae bacterium]|nr:hypothetical protein [Xanthobacteraceae bacterium]
MPGLTDRRGLDVFAASAGLCAIALHVLAVHFGFSTTAVFKSISAVALLASAGLMATVFLRPGS